VTPASGSSPPLFGFGHVSVVFDTTPALDAITLEIPDRGITAIVGPSGSGKSTLLRLCNRLEVPTSGTITFRGVALEQIDPLILRRRVGMVFQRPTPFGGTVRDNLRVAAADADDRAFAAALRRAGLDAAFLERPAAELSGGEAQRTCIARTLVTEPEALLMDEPTSALDEDNRLALERVARELADGGVPLIWVTHDLDQMRRIADRVIELEAGRAMRTGPVEAQRAQ
jgi:putative ABC transport system ATP-binding protein